MRPPTVIPSPTSEERAASGLDSVAEPVVFLPVPDLIAPLPPMALRPWTFIKNEQYYSKMAQLNPLGFTVAGQTVKTNTTMTAKEIVHQNKMRQRAQK